VLSSPAPDPAQDALLVDDVSHSYGQARAIDAVKLEIRAGELVALLGPSGCGKTTLLRIIAGFIAQTSGSIVIGERRVDDLPPNRREVGIVFQSYALFPHMTAAENVAYGLAARGVSAAEQNRRVAEMLELVRMTPYADRYPKALSGGQQQRIALARALAVRPRILLLDEPFAALDKNLRLDMQIEVKRIQRRLGTTAIMVTHDQEEALSMADRVAVLNQGRLEHFAPPGEIYDLPRSLFVNTFVGSANVLAGRIGATSGDSTDVELDVGVRLRARAPAAALAPGARVVACLRPENLAIRPDGDGLPAIIEMGLPLGPVIVLEARLADGVAIKVLVSRGAQAAPLPPGTPVRLHTLNPQAVSVFPAASIQ